MNEKLAQNTFQELTLAMVASCYSTTLKFNELFGETHSFMNVCKGRLHDWVLAAMGLKIQKFKMYTPICSY